VNARELCTRRRELSDENQAAQTALTGSNREETMVEVSTSTVARARNAAVWSAAGALTAILFSGTASAEELKGSVGHIKAITSAIDGNAIQANAAKTENWLNYGLDYSETRFSKLDQINDKNVKNLGLAWAYNLQSTRGVEATPLVIDGIMYVTSSWSVVHAIDVRTGKLDL
jgi:glucose dehydrogenase